MAKENLDELNKEIISDIKKEQKVEDLSKYAEKKPVFPFVKKKVKEEPRLEPLPEIKIPKPMEPISMPKVKKEETISPDISNKNSSIQESIQTCKNLITKGKIEDAKKLFNEIRAEYVKTPFLEPEKSLILEQIYKLHADIKKGIKTTKTIKKDVFKTEEKERRGFFGRAFGKKKTPPLEPLKPIEIKSSEKAGYMQKGVEFRPEEPLPEVTFREEDFMPPTLETEEKLREEGIIKSDFSLKELPARGKEVKPAKKVTKVAKKAKKTLKKAKKIKAKKVEKGVKKPKPITRRQLEKEEKLLKKEERLLEKVMKEKLEKKKVTDKEKIVKEKERILADKLISTKAKETRLENLRKSLDKKTTTLEIKEKHLDEQKSKYNELIKQIETLKKEARDEIRKQKLELEKREKELDNRERYLRKKDKEVDIEDRAIDYAMSEFEKEKMKLEDDEFHAYLKSKVAELHGAPAPKKPISISDIKKTESLKIPDLSKKQLSIQESIQKCKDLVAQGKVEQAKFMYNGIRLEFMKRYFPEAEKIRLHNQIRELYDAINLASLNR